MVTPRLPVLLLILAFVALFAAVEVRWSPLLGLDRSVAAESFHFAASRPWLAHSALVVQRLFGTGPVSACTLVAALLLALRGHRSTAVAAVAVMVVTALATAAVKVGVDRARPTWRAPLTTLSSPSFPSGHSSSIAAAAVLAVLVVGSLTARRRVRAVVLAGAVVVALVVGADRLLLGVHYTSDVLAGYALGCVVALALSPFLRPSPTETETETGAGTAPVDT